MSKIQWTDITANPIKRVSGGNFCERVSPGCANCYASDLNAKGTRFGGNGLPFGGVRPEARPEMTLNTEMIAKWARMRVPKRHFVGSMTDIFGEWVPDEMIFQMLDAMLNAPLQTFQLLTKRPARMAHVVSKWFYNLNKNIWVFPENIWLGVSAEDQRRFDQRLLWLDGIDASIRFWSLEPLLGPISLPENCQANWIIIGGESGPNARPMDLAWIESIIEQCRQQGIPLFVKQLGQVWSKATTAKHKKGGDPEEWTMELPRMFPGQIWRYKNEN